MKKIISAALASLMAVSALGITAFAAENDDVIETTGIVAAPVMKVTLPKKVSFIINPYKMKITAKGKVATSGNEIDGSDEQTVVAVYGTKDDGTAATSWDIVNNSPVNVEAKLYALQEATSENVALEATDDKNSVTLALQVKGEDFAFSTAAPADDDAWDALDGFVMEADGGTLPITLTGTAVTNTDWTTDDSVTVTIGYKFAFTVDDATPASGGTTPVAEEFHGAAYTISWTRTNASGVAASGLSTTESEIAEDTRTANSDIPTITAARSGFTTTIAKFTVTSDTGSTFDEDEFTSVAALIAALDAAREDVTILVTAAAED